MEVSAELRVSVAVRMLAQILEPEQLHRDAAAAQLLLDDFPVRERPVHIAGVARREQPSIELLVSKPARLVVAEAGSLGAVEILPNRRACEPRAASDLGLAQTELVLQTQYLADPPHRYPRSGHLLAPDKRSDDSLGYLPTNSEAARDRRCRKRRNEVPDCSEIRCRFAPIYAPPPTAVRSCPQNPWPACAHRG